jgi:AraC family transcriptional regulator
MHHLRVIQRALDLIEDQLQHPLPLEFLARQSGMSYWHFQRTFAAMVGEPAGNYIRRRRLTEAARELRGAGHERTILEIALDYQFESHEAFSRAFKAEFEITPSAWRAGHAAIMNGRARARITAALLHHRYRHMQQTPEIVTLPARMFAGLQARFISAVSPSANNFEVLPRLWDDFLPQSAQVESLDPGVMYGLCDCVSPLGDPSTTPDEIFYLASVQVAPGTTPPDGMVLWPSAGGTFARFIHRGRVDGMGETMGFIFGKWMPDSGYERAPGPEIERYDERFNPHSADSYLEIFIPVRTRR